MNIEIGSDASTLMGEFGISEYFKSAHGYAIKAPRIQCWVGSTTITKRNEIISINKPDSYFEDFKDLSKPENRKGKDFLIYLNAKGEYSLLPVQGADRLPESKENGRIVAGFHTLCANVPDDNVIYTCSELHGAKAGSILPQSVWDLKNRPRCPVRGMVQIPRLGAWISIYIVSSFEEREEEENKIRSVRPQFDRVAENLTYMLGSEILGESGYRLPSQVEFRLAAIGTPQGEAVRLESGEIAGTLKIPSTGGNFTHTRQLPLSGQKRLISAIGCEDMLGYVEQYTNAYGLIDNTRSDKGTWPNYYQVEGKCAEPDRIGETHGTAACITVGAYPPFDTQKMSMNFEMMGEIGIRSENYLTGRNNPHESGKELSNSAMVGFRAASDPAPNHLWPLVI